MTLTENHLTVIDTRDEPTTDKDWTVKGRIFENDHDLDGTDVLAYFDTCTDATKFVFNTLCT